MPYVIAVVVLLVGAIAFFALRSPAEAPATIETNQEENAITREEVSADTSDQQADETSVEVEGSVEVETTSAPIPTALAPAVTAPTEPEPVEVDSSGTYTASASYFTPKRTEHDIDVTLTLDGTIVTSADVTYDGGGAATPSHSAFDAAYQAAVIGQDIDTVNLSRVGGASLTSVAFNEAVADIRAQI